MNSTMHDTKDAVCNCPGCCNGDIPAEAPTPEMQRRVALWDAINRYVITCGGDPSKHVYGNTPRMNAVVEVERVVFEELGANTLRHGKRGKAPKVSPCVFCIFDEVNHPHPKCQGFVPVGGRTCPTCSIATYRQDGNAYCTDHAPECGFIHADLTCTLDKDHAGLHCPECSGMMCERHDEDR